VLNHHVEIWPKGKNEKCDCIPALGKLGAALASAQVKCPVAIEMASQQGKN
jgi:hypothetical protein